MMHAFRKYIYSCQIFNIKKYAYCCQTLKISKIKDIIVIHLKNWDILDIFKIKDIVVIHLKNRIDKKMF